MADNGPTLGSRAERIENALQVALLGGVACICCVNLPCHGRALSFPLSWAHAERFNISQLTTWVAPTVQWPYTLLLVISRDVFGGYLFLPKLVALVCFVLGLIITRKFGTEHASRGTGIVSCVLFAVFYIHTVILPSHDPLAGLIAAIGLLLAMKRERRLTFLPSLLIGLAGSVKVSALALFPGIALSALLGSANWKRSCCFMVSGLLLGVSPVLIPNLIVVGTALHNEQASVTWVNAYELAGLHPPVGWVPHSFLDAFGAAPVVMLHWWLSKFSTFCPLLIVAMARALVRRDRQSVVFVATLLPVLVLSPLADDDHRYLYIVAPIECLLWAELLILEPRRRPVAQYMFGMLIKSGAVVGAILATIDAGAGLARNTTRCVVSRQCLTGLEPGRAAQIGDEYYLYGDPRIRPLPRVDLQAWRNGEIAGMVDTLVLDPSGSGEGSIDIGAGIPVGWRLFRDCSFRRCRISVYVRDSSWRREVANPERKMPPAPQ
ncbi:MAG: hypothetical protein U0610_28995 [bacterium]